jgi:sigma-B regulation protein RsbU (phosphoserine phosphatase)
MFIFFIGSVLVLGAWNFYRVATRVTSGISSIILPSKVYINQSVEAERVSKFLAELSSFVKEELTSGSFLLAVNGREIGSSAEFYEYLSENKSDTIISLLVLDRKRHNEVEYKVNTNVLPDSFAIDLLYGSYIYEIDENGIAYRAGIRLGDVLLSVDSIKFSDDNAAFKYLRSLSSGDEAVYEVLKEGERIYFNIRFSSIGLQLIFIFCVLTGLAFIAVSVFICLQKAQFKAARITSVAFSLIGTSYLLQISHDPVNIDWISILRFVAQQYSMIAAIPVLFHSYFYFPFESPRLSKRKWLIWVPYFVILAVCIGLAAGIIFEFQDSAFQFLLQTSIIAVIVFRIVTQTIFRKDLSNEQRIASKPIVIALYAIFILLLLFNYLLDLSIIPADWNFLLNYFIFVPALLPLAYLVVIKRFQPLGITFKIRKNIQYWVLSILWIAALIGVFILMTLLFIDLRITLPAIGFSGTTLELYVFPKNSALGIIYEKLFLVIVTFAVAFLLLKIGKAGLKFLGKKYYRVKFDYRLFADELRLSMGKSLESSMLTRIIAEKIVEAVKLQCAGVFFFDNNKKICCKDFVVSHNNYIPELRISNEKKLIEAIELFDCSFKIENLHEDIRKDFTHTSIHYIIPVKSKKKLVGAMLVGEKLSESPFYREDLDFLDSIAGYAAVSIENIMLYEDLAVKERLKHELEIARHIQLASLPNKVPNVAGFDIAGISVPAFEVGGDFFDFLGCDDNGLTVFIGDVSGKGTSAALYMSRIQGILRTLSEFNIPVREIIERTNSLIYGNIDKGAFITAFALRFNLSDKKAIAIRAGHLPLYYFNSVGNAVETITPSGIGFGLSESAVFNANLKHNAFNYSTGDVFLMVTDGCTEARNKNGEEYGEQRLKAALERFSGEPSQDILTKILEDINSHIDGIEQWDDITIVVIKIKQ